LEVADTDTDADTDADADVRGVIVINGEINVFVIRDAVCTLGAVNVFEVRVIFELYMYADADADT